MPALWSGIRPTSSARAGGRMGSRLATPVAVGGGWGVGADAAGAGGEAGGGRVAGGGGGGPQPAGGGARREGVQGGLMVDSAARRPPRVGPWICPVPRRGKPRDPGSLP